MKKQAEFLKLPLYFVTISEPYRESYIQGLRWIRESLAVDAVVTGDIDSVDGKPNWIEECAENLELEVVMPLWKRSRTWIMYEVLSRGIRVKISLVNHQALPKEWESRVLDLGLLEEMKAICKSAGIDLAGENGEYHTSWIVSA